MAEIERGMSMKQQITWEQLIELNYEQVSKLQKLINQKYHLIEDPEHWEGIKNYKKVMEDGEIFTIHTSYGGFLKRTTIGKMIEILDTNINQIDFLNGSWELTLYPTYETILENELCDALWEAIKIALQENE